MKKSKSKKKKVVIAVSGMILAVSIGTIGFKYKNEIANTFNLNEYNAQTEDGTSLYSDDSTYELAWENTDKEYNFSDIIRVKDGYVVIAGFTSAASDDGGQIVKYDLEGNFVWENTEKIYNYQKVIEVDDGYFALDISRYGHLVKYSLNGDVIFDKDISPINNGGYDELLKVDDGIIIAAPEGMIKFDFNGEELWSIETGIEDNVVSIDSFNNQIFYTITNPNTSSIKKRTYFKKYDSNGEEILYETETPADVLTGDVAITNGGIFITRNSSNESDFQFAKYDLDFNFLWQRSIETEDITLADLLEFEEVLGTPDGGFIAHDGGSLHSSGYIYKFNKDGILQVAINNGVAKIGGINYTNDGIVVACKDGSIKKYYYNIGDNFTEDFEDENNGELMWENIDKEYNFSDIIRVKDGYVAVGRDTDGKGTNGGQIVKYDLEGNFVWENTEKDYLFNRVIEVDDGYVAVSMSGEVVKYSLSGKIIWEKDLSVYRCDDIYKLDDGIIIPHSGGFEPDGIIKIGFDGEEQWRIETDLNNVCCINNQIFVIDGNSDDYSSTDLYLKKYNSNGEEMLSKTIHKYDMPCGDVAITNNSIFVTSDSIQSGNFQIAKFDLDFNFLWQSMVETDSLISYMDLEFSEVVGTPDGGFIGYYSISDKIYKINENGLVDIVIAVNNDDISGINYTNDGIVVACEDGSIKKYYYNYNMIDRSRLDSLLEQAGNLVESDYSDESWNKLQEAINGTDSLTSQEEIDTKVQEIQNALNNLGVDRSALDTLLEQVAGLIESDYSDESWQELQDAVSGADSLVKQSEIDAKAEEIQNAIDNLGVDRSALDALLEQVTGLNEADYSDSSWDALQDAISGTDNLTKQSEIDAKVQEIQGAIDNLGIDRSELDGLLEQVGSLTEADYSDSSWDALQDAIAGTDNLTKQSEIDAKVDQIQNALDNLGVDRSALDSLLEQVTGLNEADYSDSSWDALQDAISGTDNLTKQSEIDAKVQEIQGAIDNLGIDRSVLDALLENVSKLNPSDYSEESWQTLQNALAGTEGLTKQSEIDAKVEEIKNAVNGLGIDRSELDAILAEVEKLVETDYSKASWDALENAINMSDTVTTQSQVDNAVEQIREAMNGLTTDRSELDRLLEEVKKLNSSDYSNSSWNALQQAITGTDNLTKQSEIDAKVNEIQNTINNLGIDRSELDRLLEEIRNLKERDYSVESWNNLQNVVKGSDTLTKQDEVNKKVDDLQKALAALTVDRSKLDEIIKKVESMDSTKYTVDSWQVLESLLDVDELTKQYEIDDRVEDIQEAINNLVLDMSKLDDLIDQSEGLNKDDYTEDSWNNLDQTVTDIKDKINNGEINEDNIDDYVTKLQDALNALQKNEDKNATDDQNVNTSDVMGMGLILTFIVSVIGILKNVKKFIFKK